MVETITPQVVRSYLAQLEKALSGVPVGVREEIVAGVAEELSGLDAATAAARIEALGDPEFIAAEARAEAASSVETRSPVGSTLPGSPSSLDGSTGAFQREPGWYPVLSALLVAFGGIVIPLVGWVVGLAMVWFSKTWTRAEKTIATLTVPLVILAIALIAFLGRWFGSGGEAGSPNPLFPAAYDFTFSGILLIGLVNVVVGIWLLWRAKRAWSAAASQNGPRLAIAPQASWYPVVTVLLIIGGGYLIPVVGWVAGVTMLWGADVWTSRQKWWGTLAGPIAVVAGFLLTGGAVLLVRGDAALGGGLSGWHLMLLAGLVLPLVANLIVGVRLLHSLARPTA